MHKGHASPKAGAESVTVRFDSGARKESYASILFFTLYRARYEVRVTSYKVL